MYHQLYWPRRWWWYNTRRYFREHTFTTTSKSVVGDSSKYTSELEVGDTLELQYQEWLHIRCCINYRWQQYNCHQIHLQQVVKQFKTTKVVWYWNHSRIFRCIILNQWFINFTGSRDNSVSKLTVVNDLDVAPITKVYIEDGGQNYNAGEKIVFDDGSADAIIGSVGDELLLEGGLYWGHFEQTAVSGQTVFSGVDNFGKHILFNDYFVKVFVDGNELTWSTDFAFKITE